MPPKKTLNLAVPADLLERFNSLCQQYGHNKQKGMVLSAAVLMFLRAEPEVQGRFLQEVATAEIEAGVKRLKNQREHEVGQLRLASDAEAGHAPTSQKKKPKPAKAAKKARKAKRGISRLPELEDFT